MPKSDLKNQMDELVTNAPQSLNLLYEYFQPVFKRPSYQSYFNKKPADPTKFEKCQDHFNAVWQGVTLTFNKLSEALISGQSLSKICLNEKGEDVCAQQQKDVLEMVNGDEKDQCPFMFWALWQQFQSKKGAVIVGSHHVQQKRLKYLVNLVQLSAINSALGSQIDQSDFN